VDGCFWHGCPIHFKAPRANSAYWSDKIRANKSRDARIAGLLTTEGWRCLRLWEHIPVATCFEIVAATIASVEYCRSEHACDIIHLDVYGAIPGRDTRLTAINMDSRPGIARHKGGF